MLINVNVLPTPYQKTEKMKNLTSMKLSLVRTTIEKKDGRRRKKYFSKQNVCEKRAPRLTFFRRPFCLLTFPAQRAASYGQDGQYRGRPNHREILIKYHKCPTFDERNAGDFQFQLIDKLSSIQMNKQMKQRCR
jgi:hypothetical protein